MQGQDVTGCCSLVRCSITCSVLNFVHVEYVAQWNVFCHEITFFFHIYYDILSWLGHEMLEGRNRILWLVTKYVFENADCTWQAMRRCCTAAGHRR